MLRASTGLSQQRLRMAKFDVETGDLDATFHPNFSGGVKAIDIEGPDVYVGGGFGTVTGTKHKNVVKLDAATGAVSAAFQGGTNKAVWCLVKSPLYDTLWVGGLFDMVDGVPRMGIGGLAGDTGALLGPEFGHMEPPVYGIDINSDGSMLFAAQKSNQGGGWRVSDGDRRWVVRMDGNAQAAKYFDGNVYFGFHDGYQGDESVKLLSVNPVTGVVDPELPARFRQVHGRAHDRRGGGPAGDRRTVERDLRPRPEEHRGLQSQSLTEVTRPATPRASKPQQRLAARPGPAAAARSGAVRSRTP